MLLRYLKDHKRLLIALPVLSGIALLLFFLYGLPLDAFFYGAAVLLATALLLFVIPDFLSYSAKVTTLKHLQDILPRTLEFPQWTGSLPQEQLAALGKTLCEELRTREVQNRKRQDDLTDYYTLWAHQIKTPLAAMRLMIQSEPGPGTEALLQELFKTERYLEMLLGYLRLESFTADLRLAHCEARKIVKDAVKKFAPVFIYQNLELNLEEFSNVILTDEKWLCLVLEQLLSNALKYTGQGSITISLDEKDVLTIKDTGCGISPEDLPRIFERGFTGYQGRQDKTATGLGLYLVKQVLDRLGNSIQILSSPGKGTEVKLFLHREELGSGIPR